MTAIGPNSAIIGTRLERQVFGHSAAMERHGRL